MTYQLQQQQTSSKYLEVMYLNCPPTKSSTYKAIQKLTAIMAGKRMDTPTVDAPTPRVVAPCMRVETTPPLRPVTTSNNITRPDAIRQMPLIHQWHTCNNHPFHILTDDDDNDNTVIATNCSPSVISTIAPPSAPPKNPPTCQTPHRLTSPPPIPPPSAPSMHQPTIPPPRVQTTQLFIPAIAPTAPYNPVHDLRPVPSQAPIHPLSYTKQQTYSLPVVEPDDERDGTPTKPSYQPRRSTRLISNRTPCNISRQVLYHIINLAFAQAPASPIPCKLIHNQYTGPDVEIKEYCNRVVHPVTKETITHYRKLIKKPILRDLWLKAMSKELHCLAQGCTGITKGTNTIFSLLHADICNIPSDRAVTYARIVIDHCPQKEDPNRERITVRGNLISLPI
jgi:hypothetical protein